MVEEIKVLARVKCKHCNGFGKVNDISENDEFRKNDDATYRCYWCNGLGYQEVWIDLKLALKAIDVKS